MNTRSKKVFTLTSLTVILTVLLSACGGSAAIPTPTTDVGVFYTQAAATIVMGLSQTAAAMPSLTPTPAATLTPEPSATAVPEIVASATPAPLPTAGQPNLPSPTAVPVDPGTAQGCYNASFVAHVTLPYAPAFKPGDRFTKTWRIKNTGTCDWPRGFKIAFASGDRFGADTRTLDQKVIVGAMADISLAMTAPDLNGVVYSNWQITTDIGKPFGPVLTATITLPGLVVNTPSSGECLSSVLVSDVSIPSGTEIKSGDTFTKTWQIKNTGTCTWNRDFKITFVGGDVLGSDTTKIRQIVGPGVSVEISLKMTAPGTTGAVTSSWQMASDNGTLFGQVFMFSITVK